MSTLAGRALIGTCGWSYDDWEEVFYPARLAKRDRLAHYAQSFRTVEIDSTFYAVPRLSTVQGWRQRSPEGFRFSAKFPREITHERRLRGGGERAVEFVETMSELGDKLGPLLIQLPPSMTVRDMGVLEAFFEGLPDGFSYALEVRHPSWLVESFATLLKRWKVSMVLSDGPHLPRVWRVTSRVVYIRWLGHWGAFDSYDRVQRAYHDDLDWWVPRIEHALGHGATVMGYVNNNYAGYSPAVAQALSRRLATDDPSGN